MNFISLIKIAIHLGVKNGSINVLVSGIYMSETWHSMELSTRLIRKRKLLIKA